eukprot:2006241-Rhodomonas_salina.3
MECDGHFFRCDASDTKWNVGGERHWQGQAEMTEHAICWQSGTTLLFIAAMNGHVAVVDSLVAARCKISQAKEVNGCLMEGW